VGQPFERTSGGGITLCNLFEGWPRDRLAAAVVSDRDLAFDVCDHYYALGSSEITWAWPLSLVRRTETPASKAEVTRPSPGKAPAPTMGARPGFAKRAFRRGLDALGAEDALRGMHLSNRLRDWIVEFKPDLVYSQLSDLPTMTLVSEILDATGLSFALHVMDDWPSSMYRRGAFSRIVRGRADRALASLLRRAGARMAISDAMAYEYQARYGRQFLSFHNPVDLDRWDALAAASDVTLVHSANEDLRLVYTGRVGTGNVDTLFDVAQVVSEMSSQGRHISLQVNTPNADSDAAIRLMACRGVTVTLAGDYSRVPGLMAAADVLLLPLDFDEQSVRLMRLSMPTKVSEYLASGKPVLTYAPRGSAVAEYARDGGWSLLVDRPDPASLRQALSSLVGDPEGREAMGAAGRALAIQRHDATKVRAAFAAQLAEAASGPVPAAGRAES